MIKISNQFIRFIFAGGAAAIINFASRIIYNQWVNYSLSIILSYITGMITAYLLMSSFVFLKGNRSRRFSVFSFILINILAVLQTWAITMLFLHYLFPSMGINYHIHEISHAIGIMAPLIVSFFGHKYITFGK